jgi:putative tryptophan/tyrosine transport system substrate-binding protein
VRVVRRQLLVHPFGRFRREADIKWQPWPAGSVENDPEQTLRQRIGVYLFHSLISRRVLNSDIRQTEFSEGDMGRREFIALAGGGALWPLVAHAQPQALPTIGLLSARSPDESAHLVDAFRRGLAETGAVEGRNVAVEYRWALGEYDRLPVLAAELVRRSVTALVSVGGDNSAIAAKAATATIPIVSLFTDDPVERGLVASLNRPGGNITGVTNLAVEVAPKRLELLHELVPTATIMALLVNPSNPVLAEPQINVLQAAAHTLGLELHVVNASSERDFDAVFANLMQLRAGGLLIGEDTFFTGHSEQLAALAARHTMPAIYDNREFVAAGGLLSYGGSHTDAYHLVGVYAARILKGIKPADLPVQQRTRVELFLNLKAAKALGITVPLPLLGRADAVVE